MGHILPCSIARWLPNSSCRSVSPAERFYGGLQPDRVSESLPHGCPEYFLSHCVFYWVYGLKPVRLCRSSSLALQEQSSSSPSSSSPLVKRMASNLIKQTAYRIVRQEKALSQGVSARNFIRPQPRSLRLASIANSGTGMSAPLREAPSLARSVLVKLGITAAVLLSVVDSAAAVQHKNVLGGPLEQCCTAPMTGFHRDGYCRVSGLDFGNHSVCAQMTQEFLEYTATQGNDLSSVVKEGEKWCLCAGRWKQAKDAGKAPPVFLKSTATEALKSVTLEELKEHALDAESAQI